MAGNTSRLTAAEPTSAPPTGRPHDALRMWWSEHRLRASGMSRPALTAVLAVAGLAVGALLVLVTDGRFVGPRDAVGAAGQPSSELSRLGFPLVVAGLFGGLACVVASRAHRAGGAPRAMLAIGGIASALFGATAVSTHRGVLAGVDSLRVAGWVALVLGLLTVGVMLVRPRAAARQPAGALLLLFGVGAGPVVAVVGHGWAAYSIEDEAIRSMALQPLFVVAVIASLALAVWVTWTVASEIAGRGAGLPGLVQRLGTDHLIGFLVAGKVLYLGAGYAGWFHPGGERFWQGRGGLTWVHAATVAVVALAVAAAPQKRRAVVSGRASGALALVVAVAIVPISYVLMMTSLVIGRGVGLGDGWSDFWFDVNSSVIDNYEEIALATAVTAGIASLVLLHRHARRLSPLVLLFGAFAVWGIPPALGTLLVSRDVDTPTFWAHLVQVDVAITVLVASLFFVCRLDRRGRHRSARVAVRPLASALICSTVLVHLTLMIPSVWGGGWWRVLIVAPVVWTMIAGGGMVSEAWEKCCGSSAPRPFSSPSRRTRRCSERSIRFEHRAWRSSPCCGSQCRWR